MKPGFISYKTTILAAVKGLVLSAMALSLLVVDSPSDPLIAALLAVYGMLDLTFGVYARDADRSDVESGLPT